MPAHLPCLLHAAQAGQKRLKAYFRAFEFKGFRVRVLGLGVEHFLAIHSPRSSCFLSLHNSNYKHYILCVISPQSTVLITTVGIIAKP